MRVYKHVAMHYKCWIMICMFLTMYAHMSIFVLVLISLASAA